MKAVRIIEESGPEGLRLDEVDAPTPGPGQLLVRVKASALNRADLLQTLGLYPAPEGVAKDIPGLEYAGAVAAIGEGVTRFLPGDRVMGLVGGGAWAELLVTHEREAMAIPEGLSFEQAAAIPEAFSTAWDAMSLQAGLQSGQSVLIHAVASGVGTAAAQLCGVIGAKALGTGRNGEKLERAKALIPSLETITVDAKAPSFAEAVKQATGGRGVEVVLDLVGGDYLPDSLVCLAPKGTLMLVGLVAGASAEVPLRTILGKRLRIIGTTLRARSLDEKIAVARSVEAQVVPHFKGGRLKPVVDATHPFADVAAALTRMSKNDTFGKHVLTW